MKRIVSRIFLIFVLLLFSMSLIYALSVGDRVECQYRGIGNFYSGIITKIEGDKVHISYDDGDKEIVPMKACRPLKKKVKQQVSNNTIGSNKLTKVVSNQSSGWDDWTLYTSNEIIRMEANSDGYVWKLKSNSYSVTIDPCIEGSDKWKKWKYYYSGNQIIAEARSKDNWVIDGHYTRLKVRTKWSNNFSQWEVSSKKGIMKIHSKGSSWKEYIIDDKMADENMHLKMTALFIVIYVSERMN